MSANRGRKRPSDDSAPKATRQRTGDLSPMPARPPSARVQKREAQKLSEMRKHFPSKLEHFGVDVSAAVQSGTQAGGKLSELEREGTRQAITAKKMTGKTLSAVLPKAFVSQVEQSFAKKSVIQRDMRKNPSKSESYSGEMFTSTYANPPAGGAEKEIPRPSSPRPALFGPGLVHAAHTAPYSVGGPETNRTKTVNAPQTANLVVDSFMEKQVLAAHRAGNEAVHARLDTDKRSTVVAVTKGAEGYTSLAAQYERR